MDERSNLYAQKDNLHPGGAPTTTWREGEFNVDRHLIDIPPGTPPGDYWLSVGLYDPHNGARLLRAEPPAGEPPDQMRIGPLHIVAAGNPASLAALNIQHPAERAYPTGLRLLGYSLDKERLPANDFLRVALFWQADRVPLPDTHMALRLIDAQGREAGAQTGAPSNDRYAATAWSAGERVRDNRALWCPGTLAAGAYRLQLRVDGDTEWIDLATVTKP
ncbi:MAG: hypothetical protein HZB53_14920 [Chloroflexi bacterium]|nr:hypothetical protein [Chloroflexota bacterium]